MADSDALLLPLHIVYTEQRSQEKENQGFEYLVEESDLSSLKSLVLQKVRMHAKDGRLRKHPRADEVLFWWARLASLDEVRSWLGSQLTTGKNAAWVLSLLMGRASSNGETRYYIKLSFAEKYVDVQAVERILLKLDEKSLSDKEKVAVREFRRALQRKRAGKPELDVTRSFEIDDSDD